MPDSSDVRVETCPTHGLRFNAALHPGCARCRKEAGEQIGSAPQTSAPAPPNGGNRAPLAGAVGLAVLLILLAGTAFYWAHTQVWTRGQAVLGITQPPQSNAEYRYRIEEMTERLGEAVEEFDPETREALLEMGRLIRQQGVPMDVEEKLKQKNQEQLRRQMEQIEPTEDRDSGGG